MRERGTSFFWRVGGIPLLVSLSCVLAGVVLLQFSEKSPPNCDFSCAMARVGRQDYLAPLLIGIGGTLSFVFGFVCLVLLVAKAIRSLFE
ncbi:hypothetical protein [Actinomadura violacea]|uniref:Uncharacterized protein n=1 Tax=Actinomadura violacea TaxID=2819934 RepID=A0ABS3RWX8_9ACTN|nr:hypothetical protein [Actinomadura violacea]MBO2461257.1 hypothetical protein [Actinomadura violacea]